MAGFKITSLIPNITGIPWLDSILTKFAAGLGGALAALLLPWLLKHGIAGIDIETLTGLFAMVVLMVVAVVWGLLQQIAARNAVISHAVEAAVTGQVPQSVIDAAKPGQIEKLAAQASIVGRQPRGLVP